MIPSNSGLFAPPPAGIEQSTGGGLKQHQALAGSISSMLHPLSPLWPTPGTEKCLCNLIWGWQSNTLKLKYFITKRPPSCHMSVS